MTKNWAGLATGNHKTENFSYTVSLISSPCSLRSQNIIGVQLPATPTRSSPHSSSNGRHDCVHPRTVRGL